MSCIRMFPLASNSEFHKFRGDQKHCKCANMFTLLFKIIFFTGITDHSFSIIPTTNVSFNCHIFIGIAILWIF